MSDTVVLSQYPPSRSYRERIDAAFGHSPHYVSIGDLRQGSLGDLIRNIRAIRCDRLVIAMEDPTSIGGLPILKMVAAATRARRLEVFDLELRGQQVSRGGVAMGTIPFLWTSILGLASVVRAGSELRKLDRKQRLGMKLQGRAGAVAYINTNMWFGVKAGGSVGHISGVANGFMDLGYDLKYLSVGGPLQIRDEADHHEMTPPSIFGLPYEANLIRFNHSFVRQAEVVLAGQPIAFLYQRLSIGNYSGVTLSRRFNVPLVVEYNGSEVWVAQKWGNGLRFPNTALAAEWQTLRHAHLIVTISDVLRDELVSNGVEPGRIVTYPNCIDPVIFDPDSHTPKAKATVRVREGIPEDACVCTFVGTFGAWHGAEVFATAIRKLCTERPDVVVEKKLRFLFVGDGLRMKEVRQILDTPECEPFVRFSGLVPQPEAPGYLAMSDILVSPHVPNADGTRFFGSPTKLFEYMAMGKAILASDLEQIGEVLTPRTTLSEVAVGTGHENALALLVEPGNADELALGLIALASDVALRAQLGKNARREALMRYTWKSHVEAILSGLRTQPPVTERRAGDPR